MAVRAAPLAHYVPFSQPVVTRMGNSMSSKSSKSDPASLPPDFIIVGKVRKPHGVRGEVMVEILSDVGGRFDPGAELEIVQGSVPRRKARVVAARRAKGDAIIRFEGFESRDDASELRGALLEVGRTEVPSAPEGSYYFFELVGCVCEDVRHGELGTVERILEDGGGLVLEIKREAETLLIPFVKAYLKGMDRAGRRIEVDLPEGLVEICTSRF